MIIEPAAHDLQRVDIVMTELEAKIPSSRKAKPTAERALINARTAQGWVKRMKEDPEWDIYEKLTNIVNRAGSQLQVEHKHFLMNLFDEEPQATKQDVVDALTAAFEGFSLKASQLADETAQDIEYVDTCLMNYFGLKMSLQINTISRVYE
ncbi:hypothetical protein PS15p_208995 [Mucor circinelloides]